MGPGAQSFQKQINFSKKFDFGEFVGVKHCKKSEMFNEMGQISSKWAETL